MPKFQDLTGQRFGRFIVISREKSHKRHSYWLCRCDCGITKSVRAQNLKEGGTLSCGCLNSEQKRQICLDRAVHLHSRRGARTGTYVTWRNMMDRCYNERRPDFARWGGRGIKVCERWHSFENFLADMGERPTGLTLDRRDNDGDYMPSNCQWASRLEQNNNQSTNRIIEFNGQRLTLSEWARQVGANPVTISGRLASGWPLAIALTSPPSRTRLTNR